MPTPKGTGRLPGAGSLGLNGERPSKRGRRLLGLGVAVVGAIVALDLGLIVVERLGAALEGGSLPSPTGPGVDAQLSEVEGWRIDSMRDATGDGGRADDRVLRAGGSVDGERTAGVIAARGDRGRREGEGDDEHTSDGFKAHQHHAHGGSPTTHAVHRRETTLSGGGGRGGGKPVLGCRLRECDQVSAPFELGKVYRNPVTMHKGKWSRGSPVKIPKFLGIEGRMTRLQRGKGSEVMHKAVKWSHLGPVSPTLAACLPGKADGLR